MLRYMKDFLSFQLAQLSMAFMTYDLAFSLASLGLQMSLGRAVLRGFGALWILDRICYIAKDKIVMFRFSQ